MDWDIGEPIVRKSGKKFLSFFSFLKDKENNTEVGNLLQTNLNACAMSFEAWQIIDSPVIKYRKKIYIGGIIYIDAPCHLANKQT